MNKPRLVLQLRKHRVLLVEDLDVDHLEAESPDWDLYQPEARKEAFHFVARPHLGRHRLRVAQSRYVRRSIP